MKIDIQSNESEISLLIFGKINTSTAPEFGQKVQEVIDDTQRLIIDFTDVDYISSAGLRVILNAQKLINAKSAEMKLIGVSEDIMEIFDMTGFADFLNIEAK